MAQTYYLPKKSLIFLILFSCFSSVAFSKEWVTGTITSCFMPEENCTAEIVDTIHHAEKTLWIQAYKFTSESISKAVIAAKERGVDVRIILDKTECAPATVLSQAGIPVWIDNTVRIAHNKIMIIDNHDLISGSFNFSKIGQKKNAENVLIIKSPELAKAYATNWENRKAASLTLHDYLMTPKTTRHNKKEQKETS